MTSKPKETCSLGQPTKLYENESIKEYSYIHEHLAFLYYLTITENYGKVLEIGTGVGQSTLAFAEAMNDQERGEVVTIDIDPCEKAKDLISTNTLSPYVTFITADSLSLQWDGPLDLLFIDGLHTYDQVDKELSKYAWNVRQGGCIVLHDVYNPAHPGVRDAAMNFYMTNEDVFTKYEFFHCNGLMVLKRNVSEYVKLK